MPLHDYECEKCGVFEHFCKIADLDKEVSCPECGTVVKRIVAVQNSFDAFKPFWCDRISWNPLFIESKQHLAEECRKRNLFSHYLGGGYKSHGDKRWV
jgi:putative FmdB family regulatory protein